MKNNVTGELTIEGIAQHFGYSKYHFSREFKRLTGFSAADYLSSLKIELTIQELLQKEDSITSIGFNAGYSSIGTFSTTFTKKTGLSPREYKTQVENLYDITKEYEKNDAPEVNYTSFKKASSDKNYCSIHIIYPSAYTSAITFIGLFKTPIPNHKPILGTALTTETLHLFKNIPEGAYYLLVCSIEKTVNPLRYFVLDDSLRGKHEEKLHFPRDTGRLFTVHLREPLPEDPPILINLPKLLADTLKFRNL